MLWIPVTVILTSLILVQAEQKRIIPVRFIRSNQKVETTTTKPLQRSARSYGELSIDVAVWTEPTVSFVYDAKPNSFGFNFEEAGHITPDFSNGLEYPDPLLLTGLAAKRAVRYLYSRELFFGDIPHIRALLRNQEVRRSNGLAENRLGSLRIQSPLYRYKKQRRLQNYL